VSTPTRQQLDIVSNAAKAAGAGLQALMDLQGFVALMAVSPSAPGIATADFSTTDSGVHQGFNPVVFANFMTQAQAISALVLANNAAIAAAFAAMAEQQS
jgi:hypothetical protein